MSGYIGIDLDGTLAEHEPGGGVDTIGPPIPAMVERVHRWWKENKCMRIVTARVSPDKPQVMRDAQARMIVDWCYQHLGFELPVQSHKDFGLVELWDDRAVQVLRNTGLRADQVAADNIVGKILTWLEGELQSATDPTSRVAFDYVQRQIAQGAWK